ncbi:hypothetical protein [Empedobacter sedimenti]|uniref:hypothetical protein n=1 Tax=Empedobacter sedimenti TaxID=3042610 RepID=UPI0024A6F3F5|nr:hypothetical protein [Empedobacter sedimenti]
MTPMTIITILLFVITFSLLLFLGIKSVSSLKKIKPTNSLIPKNRQLFIENKLKLHKKVTAIFSIFIIVALQFPFFFTVYETYTTFYPKHMDVVQERMTDSYIMGAIMFIVSLIFITIFYLMLRLMIKSQISIIPQLSDQDYQNFIDYSSRLNIMDKAYPPLIIDDQTIYVFKAGRVVEININDIQSYSVTSGVKGGYHVKIKHPNLKFFILSSKHSVDYLNDAIYSKNSRLTRS